MDTMTLRKNESSGADNITADEKSLTEISLYLCGAFKTPVDDDHEAVLC